MARTNRIALFAALAVLVALAGTALANPTPDGADAPEQLASSHEAEPESETEATEEDGWIVAHERLADAGIETDAAAFDALAASRGVGNAVRIHAWADATGLTVDEITAMRDGDGGEPVGWGVLARELGVHPGIGWIMGRGNAPDGPPGLENRPDRGADD